MNNIAIFIPARIASTRLPYKPLADINGKPMIIHVANRAKDTGVERIYIATDDEEIYNIVEKYGFNALMTKDSHVSGTDRINEALEKIDPNGEIKYLINLQGDLPSIDSNIIKELADLIKDSDNDIDTLASVITDNQEIYNPNVVKIAIANIKNNIGKALYFSRSTIPYNSSEFYHHIGIYGFKRESFSKFCSLSPSKLELLEKLEQLRALENNMTIGVKIVDTHVVGVDTEEDLLKVRTYMEKKNV